jgi:GNAT superfamily N-acetyltransferase
MDGSTWFSYRFATGGSGRPPFFLEPEHPAEYPEQFSAAGFAPLTHYVSAGVPELDMASPGPPPVNVSVRSLFLDQRERELARFYAPVRMSLVENWLYRHISEVTFVQLYGRLLSSVDPSLVRLAETSNGNLVGVAFLVPDRRMAGRGASVDTVIAKTLAVHPDVAGQGLGRWLLAEAQWRARQQGYTRGIHALIHEDNRSRRISEHYGDPFRRYTLFAQEL